MNTNRAGEKLEEALETPSGKLLQKIIGGIVLATFGVLLGLILKAVDSGTATANAARDVNAAQQADILLVKQQQQFFQNVQNKLVENQARLLQQVQETADELAALERRRPR